MGTFSSKPKDLAEMLRKTDFTQEEIKAFYSKFKKDFPSKKVTKSDLQSIFMERYPDGDAERFVDYVFRMYDVDENDYIDFNEFIVGLSGVSRGDVKEKRSFAFRLIDEDDDGFISRKELLFLLAAYYRLKQQPTSSQLPIDRATLKTEEAFAKLDKNRDELLSYEEFEKVSVESLLQETIYP